MLECARVVAIPAVEVTAYVIGFSMAHWGNASRFSPERETFSESSAERTRAAHKARSLAPEKSATSAAKPKEPAAKKPRKDAPPKDGAKKKARTTAPDASGPCWPAEQPQPSQLRRGDPEMAPPRRSPQRRTEGRPQSPAALETGASDPERAVTNAGEEEVADGSNGASQPPRQDQDGGEGNPRHPPYQGVGSRPLPKNW
uniref:Uncharacterized protein n=1 Tax=Sphaerodactylus townsendi TaxID=933632 RepID=A0ACB8GCY4_9SAUR